MPANFGTTPTSTTPLGTNQFPVSAVFVPGTASGNTTGLQGGPASTDGNGYASAPVAIYAYASSLVDGSDATIGATTDASSANTLIGLTKAIKANTANVTIGSLPANVSVNMEQVAGTTTDTNTGNASAGTQRVVLASNQPAIPSSQSGTWNITNITGTISLPTGAAQDSSVNGILLAQGSTTSGEKGPLILGAVTTSAPSYTTAQSSPISLTTAGAMRIDGSGVTQPVSGTVTANAGTGTFTVSGTVTANQGGAPWSQNVTQVGGSAISLGPKTSANSFPIVVASDQAAIPASQSGTWTVQPGNTVNTTPWLTTINQGGNNAAVTTSNALSVAEINQDLVDTGNSTTTPLTANATFTGTGRSTLNYSYIQLYLFSDQSSAANGIAIEFSSDNTNWNDASLFTFTSGGIAPNTGQTYGAPVRAQFYRIVYTNGGTNQTAFRLQTALKNHTTPADMVTMVNVPNSTNHAMLTKSSIVGLTTGGGGGYVDVKVNPAGTLTVDASGTTVPVSQSGAPWSNNITQFGGNAVVTGTGASGSGIPRVTVANDSNVLATQSGTWTVQPSNTPNTTAWLVQPVTGTSGGATASHTITASGTNATSLKASAGQVYNLQVSNSAASACFFRFYNLATAPTVGTSTVYKTIQVPASGTVVAAWPDGLAFSTGIAWACTGGIADSDTTSISTNVSVDIDYK